MILRVMRDQTNPTTSTTDQRMQFACLTDPGHIRIGNEDATYCAPRLGMFMMSDGMGGLPAGAAASQVTVHALPWLIKRNLRNLPDHEWLTIHHALAELTKHLSQQLYQQSLVCHGLRRMGATLVAVIIMGGNAHVLHVGDSRAYLLRKGKFVQLTGDHSLARKILERGQLITQEFEYQHRHLLSQHLAMETEVDPSVRTFQLRPDDRVLLCTDGLTDPLSDLEIGQILFENPEPSKACHALVNTANTNGGSDNVTALVLHWRGKKKTESASSTDLPLPNAQANAIHPVIRRTHEVLLKLETELQYLQVGSKEASEESSSLDNSAMKRLLGDTDYVEYMQSHPSTNPKDAFHHVCTNPNSSWRRRYDHQMMKLEPLFAEVASGHIPLCPVIPDDEAALILRNLWRDLRLTEQRYFSIHHREIPTKDDHTLDILTAYLLQGVRTLAGLIQLLPKFVC